MSRLIAVLVAGLIGTFVVVGLVAAARSVKESQITRRDKLKRKSLEKLMAELPAGQPRADAPDASFDFGELNPGTTSSHTFVIRNTGPVPLVVRKGPTTCKCTVSDLSKSTIVPGQESQFTLEWNTGRSEAEFRQSAKVYTSDPDRPEIDFQVFGKVRVTLSAEPTAVVFPNILPGSTETATTLVCSQRWTEFSISHVESTIEGLTWKIEPLDSKELLAVDARSGYRVVLTSPPDFSDDWLNGSLKLVATGPGDAKEEESIELAVGGKLRQRVSVYGADIDEHGVIDFGLLSPGQGAKSTLLLRSLDRDPQLKIREIRVSPDFIVAKVRPLVDASGNPKPGLYHLDLEVPQDTPPSDHQGIRQSLVTLDFEHPQTKPLTIRLSFTVKSDLLR